MDPAMLKHQMQILHLLPRMCGIDCVGSGARGKDGAEVGGQRLGAPSLVRS